MASSNFSEFMCKEIIFSSNNILTRKAIKAATGTELCQCEKTAAPIKTKRCTPVIKAVSTKKSSAL